MALELPFKISDNTLNRFGFRILTEGIKTDNFVRNPVALVSHNGSILSVGKWKNLTKEGNGDFKGIAEFDEADEVAKAIYNKYKNGYMNAVSMSVDPLKESDNPKDLLPGQKYPTVMESDLLEISFCNVPAHTNAVKLIREGKEVQLSLINVNQNQSTMSKPEKTVEQLQGELDVLHQTMAKELVSLHVNRGVVAESEREFFEKSAQMDYEGAKRVLDARKKEEPKNETMEKAKTLIELHFERGVIPATEKIQMEKVATLDYDGTKAMLEARPGKKVIDMHVAAAAQNDAKNQEDAKDASKWNYLDYYKKDLEGLMKMKKETPDKYQALLNAHKANLIKEGKVDLSMDED